MTFKLTRLSSFFFLVDQSDRRYYIPGELIETSLSEPLAVPFFLFQG